MNNKGRDYWVELNRQFDELDAVEEIVNNTSQKAKFILEEKIMIVRNYVLLKSNNTVNLHDRIVTGIIEKVLL